MNSIAVAGNQQIFRFWCGGGVCLFMCMWQQTSGAGHEGPSVLWELLPLFSAHLCGLSLPQVTLVPS